MAEETAKKILVVEDDDVLGDIIVKKLRDEGYETTLARDGEDGLEQIKKIRPDLVLLDIILPKMSGYEILEALRASPELTNTPVIILSNSGQPVEISRVLSLGVRDYLVKAEFSPAEVLTKVREQLDHASGGNVPLGKDIRVLIVEDDNFLRDLLARKLGKEEYAIEHASDGETALEMLKKSTPSVILLDIILPGIDGFEVLRRVRAEESGKNIPVIVLSNLGQRDDIEKAKVAGADDYLIKSNFTIDEIARKIRTLVTSRSLKPKPAR